VSTRAAAFLLLLLLHSLTATAVWHPLPYLRPLPLPANLTRATPLSTCCARGSRMYVIQRGVVVFGSRLLTRHSVWGDDIILSDERYFQQQVARAATYVDAAVLSRTQLLEIISHHPASAKALRKATIRLALRRAVVVAARALRLEEALEGQSSEGATPCRRSMSVAPASDSGRSPKQNGSAKRMLSRSSTMNRISGRVFRGRREQLRGRLFEGIINALEQKLNADQRHSMAVALSLHSTSSTGDAKDEVGSATGPAGFDRQLVTKMIVKMDSLSDAVWGLREEQAELRRSMAIIVSGTQSRVGTPREDIGTASSTVASLAE